MDHPTIRLGTQDYPVPPIPLGRLKRVLPAVSAFSRAAVQLAHRDLTEDDFGMAVTAIAAALGVSVSEVEEMPADIEQLMEAISVISQVAGLAEKGPASGEPRPGMTPATDSTQSTDSSPTS